MEYVIFILSYKRAKKLVTWKTLDRYGIKAKRYIILSVDDDTIDEYVELYGKENIIVFDKDEYYLVTDTMDNFKEMRTVVFARNAVFDIAEALGYEYFMVLDDDYEYFGTKIPNGVVKDWNKIFELTFKFLEDSGVAAVALAQGGDFLAGIESVFQVLERIGVRRKIMNVYFFITKRRIWFLGTFNDDMNTSIYYANKAVLITIPLFYVRQRQTQQVPGGLTDIYKSYGTFVKSFYSVMLSPRGVKVVEMGRKFKRLHHHVLWDRISPYIVSEDL